LPSITRCLLLLGDDAFNELAVHIDFAHHRIAFSNPDHLVKPDGAIELPLTRVEGIPLVPFSIEGAPPAQFELGIGNSGELLVYQSYYESHKLLEGRNTSKRLAVGTGGFVHETVATLNRAEFAGLTFGSMPAAFIPLSQSRPKSDVIAGDLGLPVLARFRLILDYSHNRVYALPYADAAAAPFAKDRLGLSFDKEDIGFAVEFVAPNSPAQAAGFKVGNKIALINGKSAEAWPGTSFANLRYSRSGTNLVFTMQGGVVRQVKLADYF
jgi:membrane-associated protease RseP (regulator of RpoE activity)